MSDVVWHWAISNPGPQKLLMWLEPWAEEFEVPIGSTIAMRLSGDPNGCEAEHGEQDYIVIWAGAGQTMEVFIDGARQETWASNTPVPGADFHGSTRDLMGLLFGGPSSMRLGGQTPEPPRKLSFWLRVARFLRLGR